MKNDDKIDFAAGLKELEAITEWFESEEVDLDEALIKFERGMELSMRLKSHLSLVENKVEKIKQKFNSPEPIVANELEAEPDLFSAN